MFSNTVKDSFKSIELLRRSGKIQVASKAEKITVPAGLRKKYITRCQSLRSKDSLYAVQQKVFLIIMKDLFKSIELLRRSGKIQVASKAERVTVPAGLRKKYITRCQSLRSKDSLYAVQQKVFLIIVKDLFKSIERLRRSGKIQVMSKAEGIIVLDGLRRKYLTRCQILRSKDYLHAV